MNFQKNKLLIKNVHKQLSKLHFHKILFNNNLQFTFGLLFLYGLISKILR